MRNNLKTNVYVILFSLFVVSCKPATPQPAEPVEESEMMEQEMPAGTALATQPETEMPETEEPMADLPNWYTQQLEDVNADMVFQVSDFQGKVVLVETMAVWCSTCFRQQQEVIQLHEMLGERDDFVSLGINIDPNEDEVKLRSYIQENNFFWKYVVASDELINEIGELYGAQYLNPPSAPMLIIDKQGEEHLLPFGLKRAEDLQQSLQPFLQES